MHPSDTLPNDKILNWFKLKAFADDKINVTQILKFVLKMVENIGRKHYGKRRKCWLPAFYPFTTIFSKAFFLRVVKMSGFCGKELIQHNLISYN